MDQYDVLERIGARRDCRHGKEESGRDGQAGFEVLHVHGLLVGYCKYPTGEAPSNISPSKHVFHLRTLPNKINDVWNIANELFDITVSDPRYEAIAAADDIHDIPGAVATVLKNLSKGGNEDAKICLSNGGVRPDEVHQLSTAQNFSRSVDKSREKTECAPSDGDPNAILQKHAFFREQAETTEQDHFTAR
jgi:hypothetical protein